MRIHIAAAAFVFLIAQHLSAQEDSIATWPVGARVRVWTSLDRNVVGYLREPRGDTLIIVAPGSSRAQMKMHADAAVRLEVSDGRVIRPRNVLGGALGGAALTVATVALLVAVLNDISECTAESVGCDVDPDYGDVALVGGAVGAVVGALKLEDQWRRVRIPGRVSLGPNLGRTALTVSFAFR